MNRNTFRASNSTIIDQELQLRVGTEDNSKIFFLINENIRCDPSFEPSRGDSSNDRSQNMILWRNMANYP